MNFEGITYEFTAKPWQYTGKGAWIFASLPIKISKEIRKYFGQEEEGWGRLRVTVQIGSSEWKTAIWFDTKANTYILPLKYEIRKSENIIIGKAVRVVIRI